MERELEVRGFLEGECFPEPPDGASGRLFFDDEPLERVLYGEACDGPTSANLYLAGREQVVRITKAWSEGSIEDAVSQSL